MSKKSLRKLTRNKKRRKARHPFDGLDPATLLMTMTGEPYQPARIHYTVYDKSSLQQIFMNLECMEYDERGDRWILHYEDEAADSIELKKSADELPENVRPVVIASLFSPEESKIYVDVNSFDRMIEVLIFFHPFLDGKFAVPTHFQVYNLFSTVRDGQPFHDILFGTGPIPRPEENDMLQLFADKAEQGDQETALREAIEYMEQQQQEPLQRIEILPLFFDNDQVEFEEEISRLTMILRGRVVIAEQHHRGNTKFNWQDLLQLQQYDGK